jgi:CO/xanthine dehydrogenase FAD-binding subunit
VRTALSRLVLHEPKTLGTALKLMKSEGPLVPIAGCTDIFVQLQFGTLPAQAYLDLSGLAPLRKIRMQGDVLVIGACATYTDVITSRSVKKHLPMLVQAAREIGGPQVQNRGTIGGNIANGSPAGDTLPVFAAAEATVVLVSTDGERRVPFTEFYTGYRATVRRADELIAALEVPPLEGVQWFRKVGTRAAQAISKVVMAAVRAPRPRIALGSVAPTVVRLWKTEAALAGGATIAEAQRVLRGEIRPIDDVRSTAAYRVQVAENLLAEAWTPGPLPGPTSRSPGGGRATSGPAPSR